MQFNTNRSLLFFLLFLPIITLFASVKDEPFIQEYHQAFPISETADDNNIYRIAVDQKGNIWAGGKTGLFVLLDQTNKWLPVLNEENKGPVYSLFADSKGLIWIGAWNGLYQLKIENESTLRKKIMKIKNIIGPITAISAINGDIYAFGPQGQWHFKNKKWKQFKIPVSRSIRVVMAGNNKDYFIGGGRGVWHIKDSKITLFQNERELLSDDIYGMDFTADGKLWIGGLGGINVYEGGKRIDTITSENGLSSIRVKAVRRAPDGAMWIGTDMGVSRFDGKEWSLRHSRRWLLNDQVRDIAFDKAGTAWIATKSGVSAIKRRTMTLAQKADYYYEICMKRHIRPPYLVEKCRLTTPGDLKTWEPDDDDNDGQYTSMYLVMESYRYAVTKDPDAKVKAKKAFEALKFLQTVTETDGYVARTVIPPEWKKMSDPNEIIDDRRWAQELSNNPREKRVEIHWHLSKDGKWLWKGDTSSDEITGHMYGYLFYYDLVADSKEKERVRDHILKIVDYIIDGGYNFKSLDGKHTTWGVWAPEYLNNDPDWAPERGINAVEILSYLKLAYHVSGKKYYQNEYNKLLNEHNYRDYIVKAKSVLPGWRTYIDDELLLLAYAALLMYEDNLELKALYQKSLNNWYDALKDDDSPYFYFFYNAFAGNKVKHDRSIFVLKDNPLDLIRWRVDNSKREDLHMTHSPILEDTQTSRLVPPSERGIMRWDKNPWKAIQGNGGHSESDGVYWLLSYWMGRYYSLID